MPGARFTVALLVAASACLLLLPGLAHAQAIGGTVTDTTGGVRLNLIPKEGSNAFSGGFHADLSHSAWLANNIDQELIDRGIAGGKDGGTGLDQNWRVAPSVGGPIARDRLWFFTTYYQLSWVRPQTNRILFEVAVGLQPMGSSLLPLDAETQAARGHDNVFDARTDLHGSYEATTSTSRSGDVRCRRASTRGRTRRTS